MISSIRVRSLIVIKEDFYKLDVLKQKIVLLFFRIRFFFIESQVLLSSNNVSCLYVNIVSYWIG